MINLIKLIFVILIFAYNIMAQKEVRIMVGSYTKGELGYNQEIDNKASMIGFMTIILQFIIIYLCYKRIGIILLLVLRIVNYCKIKNYCKNNKKRFINEDVYISLIPEKCMFVNFK